MNASRPPAEVSEPRDDPVLAPWMGGLLLDALDLATFGPVGIYGGFAVALFVGWWLASSYGYGRRGRALIAVLSALYIATPFTEVVPVATVVALLGRFAKKK